jgi:glucose dehydrogenase
VTHSARRVDAVARGQDGFLNFERVTGEPLWPIEERLVPSSDLPGEAAWPTQPFVAKPPPFARQAFGVDDVNPWLMTKAEYDRMRERVAKARNEGMFTPPGLTDTISMPGNQGGSNFGTAAADAQKGMVFVVSGRDPARGYFAALRRRGGRRRRGAGRSAALSIDVRSCHGALRARGPACRRSSAYGRMADDAFAR